MIEMFHVLRPLGVRWTCIGLFLIVIPACVKYHNLLPPEFPQYHVHREYYEKCARTARSDVRSARLYYEFATQGLFDVIWMSPQAHRAYVTLYGWRRGLSPEEQRAMVEIGDEERKHTLTFFVLADIRDRFNDELKDVRCPWVLHLQHASGVIHRPLTVEEVDPLPELKAIFGPRYSHYKTMYKVTFARLQRVEALADIKDYPMKERRRTAKDAITEENDTKVAEEVEVLPMHKSVDMLDDVALNMTIGSVKGSVVLKWDAPNQHRWSAPPAELIAIHDPKKVTRDEDIDWL